MSVVTSLMKFVGFFWKQVAYRAHAIVTHHGSEATAGHFTAVIHNPRKCFYHLDIDIIYKRILEIMTFGIFEWFAEKNDWTRFDDSRTQIISQAAATDESQQRNCYMVFYTLK